MYKKCAQLLLLKRENKNKKIISKTNYDHEMGRNENEIASKQAHKFSPSIMFR